MAETLRKRLAGVLELLARRISAVTQSTTGICGDLLEHRIVLHGPTDRIGALVCDLPAEHKGWHSMGWPGPDGYEQRTHWQHGDEPQESQPASRESARRRRGRGAGMSDPTNPWATCRCGHPWLRHDVYEYSGDGSELCCVEGCDQARCPGRTSTPPTPEEQG